MVSAFSAKPPQSATASFIAFSPGTRGFSGRIPPLPRKSGMIRQVLFHSFFLLYQVILTALLPAAALIARLRCRDGEDLRRMRSRYFCANLFRAAPSGGKTARRVILVHAVSLGEAQVAHKVAAGLMEGMDLEVLVTVSTRAGYDYLARQHLEGMHCLYLPVDWLPYHLALFSRWRISRLVVVEHDIWPGMLLAARLLKVPAILVNGHFSARSIRAYRRAAFFPACLLGLFERLDLQQETVRDALMKLGVPSARLRVTGSLKLLGASPVAYDPEISRHALTFGSCHSAEFDIIVEAVAALRARDPGRDIFLVPRHPHRAKGLHEKLLLRGIDAGYTDDWRRETSTPERVLVVAQFGVLRTLYCQSAAAVVCGSLVEGLGGHNLLEPYQCGAVGLYGTGIHAQADLDRFLQGCGISMQIHDVPSLLETLDALLRDPPRQARIIDDFNRCIKAQQVQISTYFLEMRQWCS
jgi:3-deoxy-D-manno-octulosonic-acid transferase